jgi:GAF domain-containing protein
MEPGGDSPDWLMELQALLLSTDSVSGFLFELANVTVRTLPVQASCGVTLKANGRTRTAAASDVLASQVDEIQYGADEGPCLEAMNTGSVRDVPDLGAETRWPRFTSAALGYGVRSILSTPLAVTGNAVGALNLYSTEPAAFDAATRAQAAQFAGYAAGAVAVALRLAREAEASADLRAALASRSIIDQAIGIIMGQRRCGAEEAFAVLRQASQQRNVKIHAIAAAIVEGVSGQPPRSSGFNDRPS